MKRLKKGTPGKGSEGRVEEFRYTAVASGTKGSFTAHLAGEPFWARAHEHKPEQPGTKPCLTYLTDGAIRCPRCKPLFVPPWIGWVPLYRELDGKAVIVIVHEGASDLLAPLKYPVRVLVGRCDDTSSVFVKRAESQVTFKTEIESRKNPRDITCDLLMMWGIPDLNDWMMGLPGASAPTSNQSVVKSDGQEFDVMHRSAAHRFASGIGEGAPPETRATNDEYVQNVRKNSGAKPSTNGNHKPR